MTCGGGDDGVRLSITTAAMFSSFPKARCAILQSNNPFAASRTSMSFSSYLCGGWLGRGQKHRADRALCRRARDA